MSTRAWKRGERSEAGWSVLEVLLVVFVVTILVLLLLPALAKRTSRASKVSCINHMKQVSTALRLFAYDADGRYPFAAIGASNLVGAADLWRLFQFAQDEILSPRILVCPQDSKRTAANNFLEKTNSEFSSESFAHPSKRNMSVSYFYALDGEESSPTKFLLGDRNLTRDPKASDASPGQTLLTGAQRLGSTTNETKDLRWSTEMHDRGGNAAFMDGSAQQLTSPELREALRNSGDKANRIWLPQ